ncbi:MAG: DIP1984 family protein [Treponema sp.]|nr:DIP1984 family protein [Treponema sp.]
MKLASALAERADLQKRIAELSIRLNNNAKVQEGEKPSEDPKELLDELHKNFARLEELIARINRTNNETRSGDSTISDLIAKRDCLKQQISILRDFLNRSSEKVSRYSKTEIRILSTVSVADLQKEVDSLSKQLREIDETIQGLNWTTELI